MLLLFSMYVKDEYTAKKMESASKRLGKKLGSKTEMKWQWVKNGEKMVVACDFYKDDGS
jgi:hypothetical protein